MHGIPKKRRDPNLARFIELNLVSEDCALVDADMTPEERDEKIVRWRESMADGRFGERNGRSEEHVASKLANR